MQIAVPGDVIKLTKLRVGDAKTGGGDNYMASPAEPIWGLCTDECMMFWLAGGTELGRRRLAEDGPDNWEFEEYPSDWDDYRVIPPEKWPDEITAQVVRYRLTGEIS